MATKPNTIRSNADAYLKTKVTTANPVELRLMLLEGAIRFADQAKSALASGDFEALYIGATRCEAILLEMVNSLRPEHDAHLCDRLAALYTYMYNTMVKGCSERNAPMIDEVIRLLGYERETWKLLIEQLASENRAAGTIGATPDARPTAGGNTPNAGPLVGASVSVRG
jgi:flagellar protein FliS